MGVAVNAGADPHDEAIELAVESVLREPLAGQMRERLFDLPRDGLNQAADLVAARLTG